MIKIKKQLNFLVVAFLIAILTLFGVETPANAAAVTAQTANNFASCTLPTAPTGVATFTYCLQRSPTDPNVYSISMSLNNNSQVPLDFSHTVVCVLSKGTNVGQVNAEPNAITLDKAANTATWHSSVLAPGQSDSISFVITKAANNLTLIDSVQITGVNVTANSPFSAVLPAFLAKTDILDHTTVLTFGLDAKGSNNVITSVLTNTLPQAGLGGSQIQQSNDSVIWWIGGLVVIVILAAVGLQVVSRKTKKKD